ncbi:predicted protein [Nematostella vectensis]|uniref:Uncharacterized protein n=1 Tax=Nematostella vectensis TaxID=45351 RepID=A7SDT9_NEMVE|nr:predicted protein [Nematostella vectensis]|eukprot:XP_001630196.1 predicted protein [Nematostella vectensis]
MDLQDLLEDLQDPGPVPELDNAYDKAIRKLDNHFKTDENFPYERHVFRQMAPTEGETADQFTLAVWEKRPLMESQAETEVHVEAIVVVDVVGSSNVVQQIMWKTKSTQVTAGDKTEVHAVSGEPAVPMSINGIRKDALIDSGSVSNLISVKEYEDLKTHGLNASLSKCDKKLFAYGWGKLSILGHHASKQLGVLRIGTVCNNVGDTDIRSELQAKYPSVFTGIGKLTNYKLKLHGYRHDDEYVRAVTLQAVPAAMNIQEIEKASAEDVELQAVRKCLVVVKEYRTLTIKPTKTPERPWHGEKQVPIAIPPTEDTESPDINQSTNGEPEATAPRRSGRATKPPERFKDFVVAKS